MGLFEVAQGWGIQKDSLPKIYHIYPKMMELGTDIPYLKKIQKIYESRDKPLSSADISIFHWRSAKFAISRNTDDIDCILIYNF